MRKVAFFMMLALLGGTGVAVGAPMSLSAAEQQAAFKAAGFAQRGGVWRSDCQDPGTPSYSPGKIEQVLDLNGDGRPEAVISEGGTYCYGMTGSGFWIVSQQAGGRWQKITVSVGLPGFLDSKGVGGWPDIEIGGPGFCFPVHRWNGKAYALHRHQYEGKRCKLRR